MEAGWNVQDEAVVAHARVLALDIIEEKGDGHAGTAVSLTPAAYVLFQEFLRHDPADPCWPGRDRFVLSAGHTSLTLYLQLYLSGYGLELEDLRATRSFGSRTPGHPELGVTPGVEMSTGPLGQGLGAAVGMAMAERRVNEMLGSDVLGHRVWCLVSDGDLQEGVSAEVAALAARLRLGRLTVIWDDNEITISGSTTKTSTEDVAARFEAHGWHVLTVDDAEDAACLRDAYAAATRSADRPTLVRLRTRIGHPMPSVGGTAAAHAGPVGAEEIARTKQLLGLDPARSFVMPADLLEHARSVRQRGRDARLRWDEDLAAWSAAHPDRAALLDRLRARRLPAGWRDHLPEFEDGDHLATRVAGSTVLAALTAELPELWGGSADLGASTGVPPLAPFLPDVVTDEPASRTVLFGVREHAMGTILNGIALDGLTRPFGATYFAFSDYMRPAVRMAALMELPVVYVWTHDSVAVGEDGPTHQPVEQLWSLRAVPGLDVIRPADARETAAAWAEVLERSERPAAMVLSRQKLPVLDVAPDVVARGVARGAYVVRGATDPDVLLLATGSEVALALTASEALLARGIAARVISMPCLEWFERQPTDYQNEVIPPAVRARVSVEAGRAQGWYRLVGLDGRTVSVETFGTSGTGDEVMAARGMTVDAVVSAALESLDATRAAAPAQQVRGEAPDSLASGLPRGSSVPTPTSRS